MLTPKWTYMYLVFMVIIFRNGNSMMNFLYVRYKIDEIMTNLPIISLSSLFFSLLLLTCLSNLSVVLAILLIGVWLTTYFRKLSFRNIVCFIMLTFREFFNIKCMSDNENSPFLKQKRRLTVLNFKSQYIFLDKVWTYINVLIITVHFIIDIWNELKMVHV